jgi:hypothetical protein
MKIRFSKREKKLDLQVKDLESEKIILQDQVLQQRIMIGEMRGVLASITKDFDQVKHRLQQVADERNALLKCNEKQEEQRAVAADGMRIEMNELIARAARLGMRIRGLGFDPEH